MAEVAVVASGAGLASLGIQCCKGLTAYYSSYKAYDEQIGAIHKEIEILTSLFENLERVLSRNTADPAQEFSKEQVDEIIISCRGKLQKLQSALATCQSVALPDRPLARLQKMKSRALYPFKEKTLLTLRENVQSLRESLLVALQVLQTDLGLEHKQSIGSLTAVSHDFEVALRDTQSGIQAIAAPVHRVDVNLDRLLQQGEDTKTTISEMQLHAHQYHEITLSLCHTIADQQRLLLRQDRATSRSLEHNFLLALSELGAERELLRNGIKFFDPKREGKAQELAARVDTLEKSITNLQLSAIKQPSLLQSAKQENDQLADYVSRILEPSVDAEQDRLPILRRRRVKCDCNAQYAESFFSEVFSTWRYGRLFGHEWMFRSGTHSTGSHHRACPMYSSSPGLATARFSIGICGAILNRAIEASITMTRGAEGLSIGPKLHFPRVMSNKNFDLVRLRRYNIPPISNVAGWESFLNGIIRELGRLFRDGRATPYDVDLEGQTLLHVAGRALNDTSIYSLADITGLSNEVILHSLITFCESLHDLGVPLNWVSHSKFVENRIFVQPLIHQPPFQIDTDTLSHSLSRLCRMGIELPSSALICDYSSYLALPPYNQMIPTSVFRTCHNVIDVLCRNDLHEAILHRSKPDLQAALQHSNISVDDPDEAGHTPLHLASSWPCGISLLLSCGPDLEKTDNFGHKPVVYAMFHVCTEAVQQLLRAGCSFDIEKNDIGGIRHNIFTFAVGLLHLPARQLPKLKAHNDYFEMVKIIIEELVLRRQNLMSELIDASLVHQSGIPISDRDQILDSGTASAEQSLRDVNRLVPRLQSTLFGICTVYHCPCLTIEVANELWNAGFREIDIPDEHSKTPIMVHCVDYLPPRLNRQNEAVEISFWLYQKGASLHRLHHATPWSDSSHGGKRMTSFKRKAIHLIAAAIRAHIFGQAKRDLRYRFENGKSSGTILHTLPARLKPLKDHFSLDCLRFVQKVMLDKSPDACLCACSEHGCLPVIYFLKAREDFSLQVQTRIMEELDNEFILDWKLKWLFDNVPSECFPLAVKREIVRLLTFERLRLRHTCCYCYEGSIDWTIDCEEADEIRDEDCEGIQLLGSLLPEFEEMLSDGDIKSFLEGYWSARIEEVLAARDKELVDEAGMREASVIIHRLDKSDDDLSDNDLFYT